MKYEPVLLDRYFSLVPKSEADSDEQDFRSFYSEQRGTGWKELDEEFRCVILAEANQLVDPVLGRGALEVFLNLLPAQSDLLTQAVYLLLPGGGAVTGSLCCR